MSAHPVPRVARYILGRPWAILEETHRILCEVIRRRYEGVVLSQDEIRAAIGAATRSSATMAGTVVVLPLQGVIAQKMNAMTAISGGTSLDLFMTQFRRALADQTVSAIVFDCDSPGGCVDGVPEAADEIFRARGQKPLIAQANPMIASAAYYLACACDEIVCMPSGSVGSIGVLCVHDDYSEQNAMIGYKPTYITYGTYKAELNPDQPLADDAKAYLQKQIDATGEAFVSFVAKARGLSVATVKKDFGQGRMLLAKDALAVKMIDRIATIEETIARLLQVRSSSSGRGAAASFTTRLYAGSVPHNVSEELAPKDTPWSAPSLGDFTSKGWDELSDDEKRRIAGHYAWAAEIPPKAFGDLKLPHHRASDGKVVFKGVAAAAGRLDSSDIPSADKGAVKAHLRHHYEQFKEPIPDSLKGSATDGHQVLAIAADDESDMGDQPCACDKACACMNGGRCAVDCKTCAADCPCVEPDDTPDRDDELQAQLRADQDVLDAALSLRRRQL